MSDNDDDTGEGAAEDSSATDTVVRVDFRQGREAPAKQAPDDPDAEQKREAFGQLIEHGMVLVTLDARTPGVQVPERHTGELQLGLNFSRRFFIDDFAWDGRGVRATLTFQGQPTWTDIPWASVWMLRSQVTSEAFVFPAAAPPELADVIADLQRQLDESEHSPPRADAPRAVAPRTADKRESARPAVVASPQLRPSPSQTSAESEADDDDDSPPDDEPPASGPRLRLVKS